MSEGYSDGDYRWEHNVASTHRVRLMMELPVSNAEGAVCRLDREYIREHTMPSGYVSAKAWTDTTYLPFEGLTFRETLQPRPPRSKHRRVRSWFL